LFKKCKMWIPDDGWKKDETYQIKNKRHDFITEWRQVRALTANCVAWSKTEIIWINETSCQLYSYNSSKRLKKFVCVVYGKEKIIVSSLLGVSPASDFLHADVSEPSICSIFKGWIWSVEMTGNGDRYIYLERGVLAVVGPMGRGSSGWGRFRVGELVWWGKYKRSGRVPSSYCVWGCHVSCSVCVTGTSRLCLTWWDLTTSLILPPPHQLTHSEPPPPSAPRPIGPITTSTPRSRYEYRSPFPVISTLHIQPLKMEQIDGSETSTCKNQTPGIHPKDYSQCVYLFCVRTLTSTLSDGYS
jgi:hypothetical protein